MPHDGARLALCIRDGMGLLDDVDHFLQGKVCRIPDLGRMDTLKSIVNVVGVVRVLPAQPEFDKEPLQNVHGQV